MSETDEQRLAAIKALHERSDGRNASRAFSSERDFLLRIVDAERACADAAEGRVAAAWDQGWTAAYSGSVGVEQAITDNPYR